MRFWLKSFGFALSLLVAGAAPALAAPDGFEKVLEKNETIEVKGHAVSVPMSVWMRARFGIGAAYIDLWVDADLSDFQEKASEIAKSLQRNSACGNRINIGNVAFEPADEAAIMCADIHYEKWQCLRAKVPNFKGLKVRFKNVGPAARTRLTSQNARICASVRPVVEGAGTTGEIQLEGDIIQNSVSGQAGILGNIFNVQEQFRSRLRLEVNRAIAGLKLPLPDTLQAFDTTLDSARFRMRDDGGLGMVLTMQMRVTPTDMPQILAAIGTR